MTTGKAFLNGSVASKAHIMMHFRTRELAALAGGADKILAHAIMLGFHRSAPAPKRRVAEVKL